MLHCLRGIICGGRGGHECGCRRQQCGWRHVPCEREEERRHRVCRCEMRCRWEERGERREENRCGCREERREESRCGCEGGEREQGHGGGERGGRHGEWHKCCFESHGEF